MGAVYRVCVESDRRPEVDPLNCTVAWQPAAGVGVVLCDGVRTLLHPLEQLLKPKVPLHTAHHQHQWNEGQVPLFLVVVHSTCLSADLQSCLSALIEFLVITSQILTLLTSIIRSRVYWVFSMENEL